MSQQLLKNQILEDRLKVIKKNIEMFFKYKIELKVILKVVENNKIGKHLTQNQIKSIRINKENLQKINSIIKIGNHLLLLIYKFKKKYPHCFNRASNNDNMWIFSLKINSFKEKTIIITMRII